MKKTIIAILILLMLTNVGCLPAELNRRDIANEKSANKMCNNIVKYINNKNEKGLEKYFCKKARKSDDFEDKMEDLFDFFDEEIISYTINYRGETSLCVDENRKVTEQTDYVIIEDVTLKSNVDEKYSISIKRYITYDYNKDYEGIMYICVRDSQNNIVAYVG